jgi:DNA-binding NarL/FixJ family response regulator
MDSEMIKIIITEDNDTIREGLALLINATDGMSCLAQYTNCEDMLADIKNHQADLILQDIGLPGMSGIEGVKKIREMLQDIIILMLTVYEDEDNIFESLKAGANGYLLKRTSPAQLIDAIKDAFSGGSPMSSNIARKVVNYFQQSKKVKQTESDLSAREKEILNSLAEGNSYKLIADSLFISIDTVRTHIRHIYKKLHVHSQSEALSKAFKKGYIKFN